MDRPRLASHTQSNRIERIKVPYQVARYVLKTKHIPETMLQPR